MTGITLHSKPPCPFCRSVLMVAKYLGIEMNVVNYDLDKKEHMTEEFLKMNPQHIVPTLDDNGFYLWESRAIQTYLVNKYAPDSPLYPKDPKERAIVDRMLYFDIGTLYKSIADYFYPPLFRGGVYDPEKEEVFKKALVLLEEYLSKTPYAAGDHITVADFTILASLTFCELGDYSFDAYPKITAWLNKIISEAPGYKEINEIPIKVFKEQLKAKNKK